MTDERATSKAAWIGMLHAAVEVRAPHIEADALRALAMLDAGNVDAAVLRKLCDATADELTQRGMRHDGLPNCHRWYRSGGRFYR